MNETRLGERSTGGDPLLGREPGRVFGRESGPARRRDRGEPDDLETGDLETDDLGVSAPGISVDRDPAIPDELLHKDAEAMAQRDPTPVDELRRATRSIGRRALQLAMVLFVVLVGYYFVSLWQVWATGRSDQARSVDAIVVMGAAQYDGRPSPQLAARLDHVVELWPEGLAPIVVVTGGNQPGDRFTEAEASAAYLIERGVPESAIVLEDQGSTSFESLDRVAQMLADRTGVGERSVLVVTDPYHALRSRLIAQDVGLTAYVSPTDTSVVTGARSLERHIWEAGGVAIGRISGFEWLSDLTN